MMIPGFANNYTGTSPHYEVWYGKVDVAPEKALWFRYTIFDGEICEASTWAILFDRDQTAGGRSYWELEELERPNTVVLPEGYDADRFIGNQQVFHTDRAHLDESNALGEAGGLEWDLEWSDSDRRFAYIPQALADNPLLGSAYNACLLDLRVSGTIRGEDRDWEFEGRPGMMGHIYGSKISGHRWSWAHCNNFVDHDDAVFEGLSVNVETMMGMVTPPLSAFVLHVDGREYTFRTPLSVVKAKSTFDRDGWEFDVTSGGVRLTGRAEAPDPKRVALVEYDDTDGSKLWCYNSKLADLTVRLEDPEHGIERTLRAPGRSAFEYVTREEPEQEPLI
jgi:hypothetical protein